MRRLLPTIAVAVGLSAVLTAQATSATKSRDPFLVERGRAGEFEVGMDVDAVRKLAPMTFEATYPEDTFVLEARIRLDGFTGGPAIVAPMWTSFCRAQIVNGLRIVDPRFHTARGIHVGSTLADIKQSFPAAKIVNFNADGNPSEIASEPGISFQFQGATASVDTARVTELWLWDRNYDHQISVQCPSETDVNAVRQAAFDAVIHPKTRPASLPPVVVLSETMLICGSNDSVKPKPFIGCLQKGLVGPALLPPALLRSFEGHNSGYDIVSPPDGAAAVVASDSVERFTPDANGRYTRVVFSSAGFDHGKAAVYIALSCGNLCGEGTLVLLEYRESTDPHDSRGHWIVTSQRSLWVS